MLSEPAGGLCSVQTNTGPPEYRKWRRGHGLQLPLHPQQVVGWLALGFSAVTCFLVLIPALRSSLQPALLAIFAVLYLSHLVSHVTALLLDPADPALRRLKQKQPIPEFDRTKHAHVIENGRCHLCNIQTSGPRTKHCSVCNKCVGKFDHHCKWLNHCIGGRNYAPFLMCVTSAVITAVAVLIVCLGEIVVYYVNPQWLSQWADSSTPTTAGNNETSPSGLAAALASSDGVFLVIVGALGVLAAITAGLLLHLCFFHLYISFLGLTTYEYIRAYRPNLMSTAPPPSEINSQGPSSSQVQHRPSTLHCCDRPSDSQPSVTFYACAILEDNKCSSRLRNPHENGFACCSTRPNGNTSNETQPQDFTSMKANQTPVDECCCGILSLTSSDSEALPGKSPSKKQRFQGKWNCCSSVPDSPDDPLHTSPQEHQSECVLSLCKFKTKTKVNNVSSTHNPPASTAENPSSTHPPLQWYGTRRPSRAALRIRLLFRVLSNLRTRRRNQSNSNVNSSQYRNNQVVPLAEQSNEQTVISEISSQVTTAQLPPLPPPLPPRRRLTNGLNSAQLLDSLSVLHQRQDNDLHLVAYPRRSVELMDGLTGVTTLQAAANQPSGSIRRYRRRRRHTILHNRPKSPTLSPIHESGLSNPASPVPCRHSVCSVSAISGVCLGGNTSTASHEGSAVTSAGMLNVSHTHNEHQDQDGHTVWIQNPSNLDNM